LPEVGKGGNKNIKKQETYKQDALINENSSRNINERNILFGERPSIMNQSAIRADSSLKKDKESQLHHKRNLTVGFGTQPSLPMNNSFNTIGALHDSGIDFNETPKPRNNFRLTDFVNSQ